jgi:malonate-semialdehyde dehydrogenase (acetylating)/methylmalonate-semialdehyde dehydrogenase
MAIAREEIFGPVVSLIHVRNLDEGLKLMEKSEYGNAACIYTSSGKTAREFKYRAVASMMGINIGIAAPMAFFPFGGAKGSFFGDIKGHGREVFQFFTDTKVVIQRWP